jgi:hypothetical protein
MSSSFIDVSLASQCILLCRVRVSVLSLRYVNAPIAATGPPTLIVSWWQKSTGQVLMHELQAVGQKISVHDRDRRSDVLDDRCLVVGTYGARCTQPIDQRGASIGSLVGVGGATETDPGFAWSQVMRR